MNNPPANARDMGLIPVLKRSPGEEPGNPLQYSCLGNPMDRGAWWATVHGVAKSQTGQSTYAHTHNQYYVISADRHTNQLNKTKNSETDINKYVPTISDKYEIIGVSRLISHIKSDT